MAGWLPCNFKEINCNTSINSELWRCSSSSPFTADITATTCESLADTDISGLGVLVAFSATAVMTVVIAWLMLVFNAAFVERRRNMPILDRQFLSAIRKILRIDRAKSFFKWDETGILVLQKMIISLSDMHLLAGIGILIAGWTQACSITIYHYHAVVYLAWISCSIHMVTLSISRVYLRENKPTLVWRLVLMSVLFVLLFFAICLTASKSWPSYWAHGYAGLDDENPVFLSFDAPAVCSWSAQGMSTWRIDTIFSLIILTVSFVCRLAKVFETSSERCRLWLRTKPENQLKRLYLHLETSRTEHRNVATRLLVTSSCWLNLALYLYIRAIYDIFESSLVELVWMTLAVVWGFAEIFTWRSFSQFSQFEKKWSFGQILPLLLVIAPLAAIPEMHHEARLEVQKELQKRQAEAVQTTSDHSDIEIQFIQRQAADKFDTSVSRTSSFSVTAQKPSKSGTVNTHHNSIVTQIALLDQVETPYSSLMYHFLLVAIFCGWLAIFITVLINKLHNGWDTSRWAVSTFFVNRIVLPCLLGPAALWVFVMAPFSRVVRRTLGDSQYQPNSFKDDNKSSRYDDQSSSSRSSSPSP